MPRRNVFWLLGVVASSLFCWALAQGSIVPPRGPLQFVKGFPGAGKDYDRISLLVDVLEHVEQAYVHELTDAERDKFVENAIEAGLQSLDHHSSYFAPKEYKNFMKLNEGSFGGIGVQINVNRDTKRLTVISPIVGTPAYKAGIKPGDEIEKINGENAVGLSNDEAVDRIQGPPGTPITLSLRRRATGRTFDVTLTRSLIEVENLLGDTRDGEKHWDYVYDKTDKIGYIRLVQFNKKSEEELRNVIVKLKEQGLRGLVLDLRSNPGGLLDAAVGISDLFLEDGKVVSVEGRGRTGEVYNAQKAGTVAGDMPLAILINEQSASASEIVAAALQDHKRATIIGERSFGKGSVQNLIPMQSGKSALKLTTAKYVRPNGKNIQRLPESKESDEWGVTPDVEVNLTLQEKIDYWTGRRDRDVVRDDGSDPELAERFASVAIPLGAAWPYGGPAVSAASIMDAAATTHFWPRPKRPYADKVLDTAVELLKKEANGSAAK